MDNSCILGENTALILFWLISGPDIRTKPEVEVDDITGCVSPDEIEPDIMIVLA